MTADDGPGHTGEEKEREAVGGEVPGPSGDVDTRSQMAPQDGSPAQPVVDGSAEMTAAEESGQVAFGAGDSSGETGATGGESSSG